MRISLTKTGSTRNGSGSVPVRADSNVTPVLIDRGGKLWVSPTEMPKSFTVSGDIKLVTTDNHGITVEAISDAEKSTGTLSFELDGRTHTVEIYAGAWESKNPHPRAGRPDWIGGIADGHLIVAPHGGEMIAS
jgi:hypothetical protein